MANTVFGTGGYKVDYHPCEIADALCELIHIDNEAVKREIEDALYDLKATVENPYNFQFYTTMYMVLESLTFRVGSGDIRAKEY